MRKNVWLLFTWLPVAFFGCSKKSSYDGRGNYVKAINNAIEVPDLPPGLRIKLNVGSSIEYNEPFDNKVLIKGEAYFEIDSTAFLDQELLVKIDSIRLRMRHGTFNINAYDMTTMEDYAGQPAGFTDAKLSVVEGRLRFTNYFNDVELENCGVAVSNSVLIPIVHWRVEEQTSWVSGYYSFEMIEGLEFAKIVGRVFSVKVNYGGVDVIHGVYLKADQPLGPQLKAIADANPYLNFDFNENAGVLNIN